MNIERRCLNASKGLSVEKRADGKSVIVGYAAKFYDPNDPGTEYELWSGMVERCIPGCFDRALREKQDILALFNHDLAWVLGRTSSGTCTVTVDKIGLRYEVEAPDTAAVRDQVISPIMRGDMNGSSFSFTIPENGQRFIEPMGVSRSQSVTVRELHDVDLHDLGPTPMPAYKATTSGMRAIGDVAEIRCACEAARPQQRGAVTYANGPTIDEDDWDEDAAKQRVAGWANEGDRTNMRKLSRAYAYSDGSSSADGMKLLHHDVRGGKLHVHAGAVERCMRSLASDGGGGVPEADRAACQSHLQRHLDAMADPDDDEDDSELEPSDLERDADEDERKRKLEAEARQRQLQIAEAL